ncbi:MAG: hypothetical protein IH994_11995 [Proteobacteria bacterium]|nr:hypothetical protein [Pseudomonadota bacterium]
MIIIISSLALFVALTALWFASASLKKFEAGNTEIKKLFKADINILKAELEKKVTDVTDKMKKYEARMGGITEGQTNVNETSDSMKKELATLRKELNDLLFRLPPQYRVGEPSKPIRRDVG